MARQLFGRGAVVPSWPSTVATTPSFDTLTTDANDEVAAIICRAPKTGNVRAIWSSMQVGTGADRTIGLYTVDADTGAPTTPPTAFQTNSFALKTIASGDNNDLISSGSFGADCPVVKGDVLAVCWITPASSPGNILINTYADARPEFPYRALYTGSWTKSTGVGNLLFEYDDGTMAIPWGCIGIGNASANTFTTVTFNNTSTPDAVGARLQFPGPVRVNGAWLWGDFDGGAKVYLVDEAWDGTASDALAEATIDTDLRATTGAGIYHVEFDDTIELTAGTWYRLVVEPDSGTNMSIYYYSCESAAQLAAQPLGALFHYTSAKDPNDNTDWTNFDNGTDGYRVPLMGLCLDQIADDAGVGGGSTGAIFSTPIVRAA